MHIPSHFYYETLHSEGDDYGVTPTGSLSVPRLLANTPYWQKPLSGTDTKPKTLIIHTTTQTMQTNFSDDELDILGMRFAYLQELGFKLHKWHNGRARPLYTEARESELAEPKRKQKLSDQFITDAAMQQLNLTHDEVLVLNENDLYEFMLGGNGDWPDSEDFKIVDLQDSPISTGALDSLLADKANSIVTLNLAGATNLSRSTLANAPLLPQLKELLLHKETSSNDEPRSNLSVDSIVHLIRRSPQLRHMTFCGGDYPGDMLQQILSNVSPSALEELDLTETKVTFDLIFNPDFKLKKLNVSNGELAGDIADNAHLDCLTQLQLVEGHLNDFSVLIEILSGARNLTRLVISDCYLAQQITKLLEFPSLKEVCLTARRHTDKAGDEIITAASLHHLLSHALELENLMLSECAIEESDAQPLQCANLQSLALDDVKLSMLSLESMLTPKLTTLHLTSIQFNSDISQQLQLESLDQAFFEKMVLSALSFERLFFNTTQLLNLSFTDSKLFGDLTSNFPSSSLEESSLCNSILTARSFFHLFAEASKLRKLELGSFELTGELVEPLHLESLEELSFANQDIKQFSAVSLEKILLHAHKLKKLILNNQTLDEDIAQDLLLGSLEELSISYVLITAKSLKHLLVNASKLKTITLRNCTITGDINEVLHLDSLDKITLNGVTLSPSTVQNILLHRGNLTSIVCHRLHMPASPVSSMARSYNTYEGINQIIQNMSLEHLKEVDFSQGPDLDHKSQLALMKCPNLNILKLAPNEECEYQIASLGSSTLRELELTPPAPNHFIRAKIILTSHHSLKKLHIEGCNLNPQMSDNLDYKALEVLKLSFVRLHAHVLAKILMNAPLLSSFEFKNSSIVGNLLDFIDPNLLHDNVLKTLTDHYELNLPEACQSALPNPITSHEEKLMDADTVFNPDQKSEANRYFYAANKPEPSTNDYRLNLYNKLEINPQKCTINSAFKLMNKDDLKFGKVRTLTQEHTDLYPHLLLLPDLNHDHYYGRKMLQLSTEWQALPSLSPHELMTHYHLDHPEIKVDIRYSARDSLYYIKCEEPPDKPVSLDFLIAIPKDGITSEALTFPSGIQALVDVYRNFNVGTLQIRNPETMTGTDYMQALQTQRLGSCRHRSVAFFDAMQQQFPNVPVRMVGNDCHMFVEILIEGHWLSCNLGGYPCQIKINEPSLPPALANDPLQARQTETITLDAHGHALPPKAPRYFTSAARSPSHEASSPKDYFLHLLQQSDKSVLLKLTNTSRVADAGYHLQDLCYRIGDRPCFYIDSPDDLVCSATWIERHADNTGTIRRGPGGTLFEFLEQHRNDGSNPLLIVNYNHFTAADIVRFNALLDDKPNADGINLPAKATVIGLMNPNERGAYTGLDFTSRFATRHDFPEQLLPHLDIPEFLTPAESLTVDTSSFQTIDVYASSDWQGRLLGRWILKGQDLTFVEGDLIAAIKAGKTHIDIKNGPWHDKKFVRFWQEAMLTRQFQYAGQTVALPESFTLSQSSGFEFKHAAKFIHGADKLPKTAPVHVLNPSTLAKFFNQYRCDHDQEAIYQEPGYLEANTDTTISVYLSHAISPAAWSELLDACAKYRVHLQLMVAPGVRLPTVLGLDFAEQVVSEPTPWSVDAPTPKATAIYIESSDADVALAHLKTDIILDVSELEPTNLLMNMDGKLDQESLRFQFHEKKAALLTALDHGQAVILKGQFSLQMQHYLSEELIKRGQSLTGKLILISDKPQLFSDLLNFKHMPTVLEKRRILENTFKEQLSVLTDAQIQDHSLTELNAIVRHQIIHPKATDLQESWLGMEALPKALASEAKDINLKHAQQIAEQFNQDRYNAVQKGLAAAPFVFLAGMTGVGKTTFIEHVWKKTHPAVHFGEGALAAWAHDQSDGVKTLFIDEANLSARQWSQFEGLFNDPPGILINHKYVELSPEHNVIFAGNPVSYGGGRHLPELFKRHGGSIIFEPMPPEYIYHEILKPVFENTCFSTDDQEVASLAILDVASYLTQISRDEVLISPRELAMMALLAVNYCQANPSTALVDAAAYYAYTIARSFVPEHARAEFDENYGKPPRPNSTAQIKPRGFSISESNHAAFAALSDFLSLRETRRRQPGNKVQQTGGLGGLILEGEPGIGKSELAIAALIARGYEQEHDFDNPSSKENPFYIIPPSMALEAKKTLLLKAYREGAVVIINEINSSSMMERFLNDLLMGKTPPGVELENIKPGFMVIGTQNPTTMAGRARTSLALQHRMQTLIIAPYKQNEMTAILIQKGLPQATAEDMASEYHEINERAIRNQLTPPLCFRDLIKRADYEIKAHKPVVHPKPAMTWDELINNPFKYSGNVGVRNKTHALLNLYHVAPEHHHQAIKSKLNQLAVAAIKQPEAWLALALIASLEKNTLESESYLEQIQTTQPKETRPGFFGRGVSPNDANLYQALLSGAPLKQDIREVNAFIAAYAESIQQTLGLGGKPRFDVI